VSMREPSLLTRPTAVVIYTA